MKKLYSNFRCRIRNAITLLLIFTANISFGQHIHYMDRTIFAFSKEDGGKIFKKKKYIEPQNYCDLLSNPRSASKLPLLINRISPEMVKILKVRYAGRLYSITALNMIDERLKYKLKICDKDNGKFRSEYLDKDANIVNDPSLDY